MKLIEDWRRAWRLFSMQALLIIAALQGILAALPQTALDTPLPGAPSVTWGSLLVACSVAAAIIGALGRLIDQTPAVPPTS